MKFINNQKGTVPVLLLLATLGLLTFIGISSSAPFKDKLFATLFPKPASYAASNTDTSYNLGVLVIKYFPLTVNGFLDLKVTGDIGESYSVIKKRTDDVTNQLKVSLEKASTYLGYKDSNATPSLKYTIVDTKEYTQAVPLDSTTRRPVYIQILNGNNICDYVDNKGVTEVWLWAYQGPTYPGSQYPYLNISESKMSGPFGDISNSYRGNDMPICKHTYRLYTFNYQRYTSEALESWGHQIEAEMDAIDKNLYRNIFQGPNYPQTLGVNGRCGSVHNPPNARSEYDRANPTPQKSDCLDWKPDSLGTLSDISCSIWGCQDIDPVSNNASLNYQIWVLQNMPGRGNTKTYQGKSLRNWWDVHGDFDNVMRNNKTLFLPQVSSTPAPQPKNAVVYDSFNRSNSFTTLGRTDTSQGWVTLANGSWGINNNLAYPVISCPAPGYSVVESGLSDASLQVTLTVNKQDIRIPFRVIDTNNLLWLENRGNFYDINKMEKGIRISLASSVGITPANLDTVRIDMLGDDIKVYINNVLRISTSNHSIKGTKHGIGVWCSGMVRFDDFSISSIVTTSSPTPTPTITPNPTITPQPTPSLSPSSTPTTSSVSCTKLEKDSRGSGKVISGVNSTLSASQKISIIASINKDDGNRSNIVWNTSGGSLQDTSWDLTDWIAPTVPGTYTISMKIYGVSQPQCVATIVVPSLPICTKLEKGGRGSGQIISGNTTSVGISERIGIVASINNDDGSRSSITWNTTGGSLQNTSWDLTDWIAPATPGSYMVSMNIYGTGQSQCIATFNVH